MKFSQFHPNSSLFELITIVCYVCFKTYEFKTASSKDKTIFNGQHSFCAKKIRYLQSSYNVNWFISQIDSDHNSFQFSSLMDENASITGINVRNCCMTIDSIELATRSQVHA